MHNYYLDPHLSFSSLPLPFIFTSTTTTQYFFQIIAEFLSTDAIQEEIYAIIRAVEFISNMKKEH